MSEQVDVVGAVVPLTWLYTHCRAVGMTCVSDSGKWEHDIALFIVNLQAEITALRERVKDVERERDAEYNLRRNTNALLKDAIARAEAAKADAARLRKWLDNNTTHYNTAERESPVLASVSKRIWYHASDDMESWPFSAAIDAAMSERK
jgi:hypothetical protein